MSKQVRLDDSAYEKLKQITRETRKQQSVVASQILEVFSQIFEQLKDDDRLIIKDQKSEREVLLPFSMKNKRMPQD
jgi:hypothetical protein